MPPPLAPLALDDQALSRLLDDDVAFGDLTTDSLGIGTCAGAIEFCARDAMVVCGSEEAARLLWLAGADQVEALVGSGTSAVPHTPLVRASGRADALHRAWKTAQTLMEWCAGIATCAQEIVAAARRGAPDCVVAGTRKNSPGTRRLAAKALRAGGAVMHRLGLSETLLVFAEHRLFLDDTPAATIAHLRQRCPERRIVVEVTSQAEAMDWAGCDLLQLERFSPADVAELAAALAAAGAPALLAVAGGVQANNAEAYARAGARVLVTSAPHFARPRDVQVRFARR